jgi:hypothetical protein
MGNTITPGAYQEWRDTPLGSITEKRELDLVLDMAGELAGRRVLDRLPAPYTTIGAAFIAVAAHRPSLGG